MLHYVEGHMDGLQYKHVFQKRRGAHCSVTIRVASKFFKKMLIFKYVLFATRKPQNEVTYEMLRQAKIVPKPVPTVIHSLPTPYTTAKPSSTVVELG